VYSEQYRLETSSRKRTVSRRGCSLYSEQERQDCELDRLESEQEKLDS
jgi:hypothetical protein